LQLGIVKVWREKHGRGGEFEGNKGMKKEAVVDRSGGNRSKKLEWVKRQD
jgi:hypothetical protein